MNSIVRTALFPYIRPLSPFEDAWTGIGIPYS